MIQPDPRASEFAQFKRVLEWTSALVTRMLHEEGKLGSQVFFVRMGEKTIGRVGVVSMANENGEGDRHLDIMHQVVALEHVDVAAYVREASEPDPATGTEHHVVMFHLMGKVFEVTVLARKRAPHPALEQVKLKISDLHPKIGNGWRQ